MKQAATTKSPPTPSLGPAASTGITTAPGQVTNVPIIGLLHEYRQICHPFTVQVFLVAVINVSTDDSGVNLLSVFSAVVVGLTDDVCVYSLQLLTNKMSELLSSPR